ncbi:catabolite repressor/activator [Psychromonas antarctica]|jgi:LacI family fructose operon transcriptional repressor|uniref:catabolite repressor/activator n=1 Tax=Psychromonas antarctica TaxID=67573 RepID=UPI001EE96957|nr:catabolite repressor/activator [Psychromonas antarctica]MCG6201961.1 catabolite repressor/activator [Psychromonas antarctica]
MTLQEIAKLAGVSRTTASYIINGKSAQYRISEKTRKKVMAVVTKYNYKPNYAASSLRAGNSHTFGLVIPDLENTSYAKLAKLLERDARKEGFQLVISCSDDDPDTEMSVVSNLVSRGIDVLIIASVLAVENNFYREIQAKGLPVVAIDRYLDDEIFASVISEDLEGALELTQSLLEKNVHSIGLIGAVPQLGISKEREQGFKAALSQQPNSPQYICTYGEHFSLEQGRILAQQWIDQDCFPDAILVTSYVLFEGVLDCLLAHPKLLKSVDLATFGDNRLLDFLPVKIQSLPQQFELIAEKALELALSAAKGIYHPCIEVIPRKLVRR